MLSVDIEVANLQLFRSVVTNGVTALGNQINSLFIHYTIYTDAQSMCSSHNTVIIDD